MNQSPYLSDRRPMVSGDNQDENVATIKVRTGRGRDASGAGMMVGSALGGKGGMGRLGLVGLLLLAVPGALHAQRPGDRVRVAVQDSVHIGEVTTAGDSVLHLDVDGVPYAIDYGSILEMDRSIGTRSLWLEGMGLGALAPIAIGGGILVGCVTLAAEEPVIVLICALIAGPVIGAALVAIPIGAVVGAIIGAQRRTDVWEPVTLSLRQARWSPTVLPMPGPAGGRPARARPAVRAVVSAGGEPRSGRAANVPVNRREPSAPSLCFTDTLGKRPLTGRRAADALKELYSDHEP